MDLLASLHLEELPEQQTRIAHLSETLAKDPDLKLGFNACCTCAARRPLSVSCRTCRRVRYCSETCRELDAAAAVRTMTTTSDGEKEEEEEEAALGHSSVICALLSLCQADEDVVVDDARRAANCNDNEAAIDRVQSEYESYPATLANVLMDGPCYRNLIHECSRRKDKEIVIHVLGASIDAELWGNNNLVLQDNKSSGVGVWDAYGEALGQLAEIKGFATVCLHLIGPDCPSDPVREERRIRLQPDDKESSKAYRLKLATHKTRYTHKFLENREAPDVVVLFNPGLTCPDYDWREAVSTFRYGTAFLVTTNTQLEGIGDCQYLLDNKLLPALPPVVAEILEMENDGVDGADDQVFFGENPYAGSRVRQSGTMANDVYVKNRWMLGGVFDKPIHSTRARSKPNACRPEDSTKPRKKQKGDQNTKRSNPALI